MLWGMGFKKEIMNRKYRWLFFDLDGTLADSIPALMQVYQDFLGTFGKSGTKEDFEVLNGPSLPQVVAVLKEKHQLLEDDQFLVDAYKNRIAAAYRNIVKPMHGASTVLEALTKKDCKLMLVTSADRDIALHFIRNQRWDQFFQGYVFGSEVYKSKPASEIYDIALIKSGDCADSVVVVEDSMNGIKSAKESGAFVVGLTSHHGEAELLKAGANITITCLEDILPILDDAR